ncbi:MAG: cation-translocating P-type ATPase, partial [Sedimentisphaerales bacterium]|nr:cation-translocating P-type ATPase [Sedimentisphaerales bacterium]
MAHQLLGVKEQEMAGERTKGRQLRVSLAMLGTLAGGVLLLDSKIAPWFYGDNFAPAKLCAMIGAILLGAPVVWHALRCVLHGHMHMDELVALAIVAAFANGQYVEAGVVGFIMLLSELMETRTALGARASIESLIKLTPTTANRIRKDG